MKLQLNKESHMSVAVLYSEKERTCAYFTLVWQLSSINTCDELSLNS